MRRIHDSDDPAGKLELNDADFPFLILPPLGSPGLSLQQCGRAKRDGTMVNPIILSNATEKAEK